MAKLTWNGPIECPGCGGTAAVGIMSLATTCRYCGMYFVDIAEYRGWYASKGSYESGRPALATRTGLIEQEAA